MPLSEPLDGWTVEVVPTGMSGASVERWTKAGERDRYRKCAPTTWDRGLDAEAERLRWLATTPMADRVATVLAHEHDEAAGVEHLVTSAVEGTDGATLAEDLAEDDVSGRDALARRYGAALRQLHDGLDPAACPFDARLDVRLEGAARRVAEGRVDVGEFEPENEGRTPAQLLEVLRATRPEAEDLVVAHGDWCYPNVLFDDDGWTMVDLADLGVACRWYDLGIGARSTSHNLGDEAIPAFFEGYGVEPDEERLAYYILLDELQ